jgi:hypothetical protein
VSAPADPTTSGKGKQRRASRAQGEKGGVGAGRVARARSQAAERPASLQASVEGVALGWERAGEGLARSQPASPLAGPLARIALPARHRRARMHAGSSHAFVVHLDAGWWRSAFPCPEPPLMLGNRQRGRLKRPERPSRLAGAASEGQVGEGPAGGPHRLPASPPA